MPTPDEIPAEIEITGEEEKVVPVEQVANFLRDLVFLHDRLWILASKDIREYPLTSGYFYTRNGRPVPPDQQLQLVSLHKESPISIVVALGEVGAAVTIGLTFFKLLRGALLFPGELKQQALNAKKTEGEIEMNVFKTQALIREAEDWRVKRLSVGTSAFRSVRNELEGLKGHDSIPLEEVERVLARDVDRLNDNEIAIVDVVVRRYREEKKSP